MAKKGWLKGMRPGDDGGSSGVPSLPKTGVKAGRTSDTHGSWYQKPAAQPVPAPPQHGSHYNKRMEYGSHFDVTPGSVAKQPGASIAPPPKSSDVGEWIPPHLRPVDAPKRAPLNQARSTAHDIGNWSNNGNNLSADKPMSRWCEDVASHAPELYHTPEGFLRLDL